MASIRKRGENSYLLVVSMGTDGYGKRRSPKEKMVHPPTDLTPKAKEKWLQEEAALFERQVKQTPLPIQKDIKMREYVEIWLREIAPNKLAKTTLYRTRQDIERFMPTLGNIKLTQLRPDHFRNLYADLRKQVSERTGKPFSEHTIEGVHSALCGILSDAMAAGYIQCNPAWRTYKPIAKKQKKTVADEETAKKLLTALEQEDMKYEVYFKLILLTGIRRGECCGIQWGDIDWSERSIHIYKNVVKVTGEELFVKSPKTTAGDRYVYFSQEMEDLLKRYKEHCENEREHSNPITDATYLFRRQDSEIPRSTSTFTSDFKMILKAHREPRSIGPGVSLCNRMNGHQIKAGRPVAGNFGYTSRNRSKKRRVRWKDFSHQRSSIASPNGLRRGRRARIPSANTRGTWRPLPLIRKEHPSREKR